MSLNRRDMASLEKGSLDAFWWPVKSPKLTLGEPKTQIYELMNGKLKPSPHSYRTGIVVRASARYTEEYSVVQFYC